MNSAGGQARDHLERLEFATGLALVDSVLDLIDNPDLQASLLETKFDLLYKA